MLNQSIIENQVAPTEKKGTAVPSESLRSLSTRLSSCLALAALAMLTLTATADARILDLEELQSTSATSSWDFELADRFEDKTVGTLDLTDTQTNPLTFPQGFDDTTEAIQFPTAEGFAQTASFTQSNDATIEFLILPSASAAGEQHFLSQVQANTNRNYMFQSGQSSLRWNRGRVGLISDVIGGGSAVAFDANDWYYVALTSSYSSGSDEFTLNGYARNLTDEGPLVQVLTNVVATNPAGTAGLGSTFLRFGKNAASGNNDFSGTLDAVAYYDSVLSLSDAQLHSNLALHQVPEPSTGLILLVGWGMLVRLRRGRKAA